MERFDTEEIFHATERFLPGLSPAERQAKYAWAMAHMFAPCSKDLVELAPQPAPHVMAAFEEVFGRDRIYRNGRRNMDVRMHPIFNRWVVVERSLRPDIGDYVWEVVQIAEDGCPHRCDQHVDRETNWGHGVHAPDCPGEHYIPSDWEDRPDLHHLAGVIGEYREFTQDDFAFLEMTDRKKYTATENEGRFALRRARASAALERDLRGYEEDFVEHYANMFEDEANQKEGSGQRMHSFPAETYRDKSDERWVIEERNGFKIRQRVGHLDQMERKAAEAQERRLGDTVETGLSRRRLELLKAARDAGDKRPAEEILRSLVDSGTLPEQGEPIEDGPLKGVIRHESPVPVRRRQTEAVHGGRSE